MPHRCHRDGQVGPFFEESWRYSEAGDGDDRELTLYHSAEWLRHMCAQPGSPFAAIEHSKLASLQVRAADAEARADRLEAENAEIRRRLESNVTPQLAELAELLDTRYARRSGPRPKAEAST